MTNYGEGGDANVAGVGHGEGLGALEWSHGHVGDDGRPQGEGWVLVPLGLYHPTFHTYLQLPA